MYQDADVIGYWVKRRADKPHECVVCTTCYDQKPSGEKTATITFGEASDQDEPPVCIECGCYLPTLGEP